MSKALEDVAAERRRQVEAEGWTSEHDDKHDNGEMAIAAACYATAPPATYSEREWRFPDKPKSWPWHRSWWKPKFYRDNLVKAAALLIAEIERLDRLKHPSGNAVVEAATAADIAQDAARFRALMRCGRIKPQGSAGVDPKTGARTYPEQPGAVHFGAEFWVQPEDAPSNMTVWGRHCLRALADDILAFELATARVG